ncbi:T7SS effector LXG polymorphic toxin [Bacillus siamensis]|uniref:TopI-like protein YobL n=1 Tax=Bacillus siamensis TaxID=659243 RepID=A0AAI8HRV1_9BACI|nr:MULTISPECIES: T7SS effector LXG polymorphic toxin [Bacillus]AME06567.1 TopI - like protein YobL [Bacillus sp. SDLI1]AUJ79040.1 TopI - like protein YobL [Bacillus siamensis]UUA84503.1 T7SS effector LXG polymorphic toxin [Bacillus siamensis]
MKLLETNTLIQSANSRLKAYQKTKDDMIALKQQFHGIANTDAMSGKGADAIKAFYTEQAAGTELWLDLCDMKITFFKSIPREIEQAGFGRHDLLEESFLDSELKHAGQRAYHIIDGQHDEISRILGSIDDILSLSPFDKSSVTGKLDAADHKKRQTAEHLHKLDAKLVHEYAQSEALEHEVEAFFRTLADLTSKAGGPQSFNAKAFHDTDVYKRKDSIQKQAHQYIKMKQQEETAFLQKKLDSISDPDEYVNIAEKLGADNMSAEQLQYYSSLVQLKAMRQAGQMLVDGAKGITLGIWDAGKDAVIGAYDFAIWLQRAQGHAGTIEQAKAGQELIGAIYNAPETFDYMVQSFKTSWNENIIHGDTYSRTHYIAYAAVSLLGAKGAGEVTGVTRAGRFVTKEAKTFIADQKKAAAGIYAKGKSSISQPWKPAIDVKQENVVRIDRGDTVKRVIQTDKETKIKKGNFSFEQTKELTGFSDNISKHLEKHGLDLENFHELRLKPVSELSSTEIKVMKEIRDAVPLINKDTLLQKTIPIQDVENYLSGKYTEIGGYVAKAEDVANIRMYDDVVESSRLDYAFPDGTRPYPEGGDSYAMIRFKTSNPEEIEIPYGKQFGGSNNDGPPCTQNGFTGARNGKIIPEWVFTRRMKPKAGSELYKVINGQEQLVGIFDGKKFIKLSN